MIPKAHMSLPWRTCAGDAGMLGRMMSLAPKLARGALRNGSAR